VKFNFYKIPVKIHIKPRLTAANPLMIGLIIFTPRLSFDGLGIKTMKKFFEFPYFRLGNTSWYPF